MRKGWGWSIGLGLGLVITPLGGSAWAQVHQDGTVTATHCAEWTANGKIGDSGGSCPGGGGTPGGTSGQVQYNNSGAFGGFTPGGDVTGFDPSTGAFTVTKTNGTNFGSAAVDNVGTSGSVLCLLNANCVFSGNLTLSSGVKATGLSSGTAATYLALDSSNNLVLSTPSGSGNVLCTGSPTAGQVPVFTGTGYGCIPGAGEGGGYPIAALTPPVVANFTLLNYGGTCNGSATQETGYAFLDSGTNANTSCAEVASSGIVWTSSDVVTFIAAFTVPPVLIQYNNIGMIFSTSGSSASSGLYAEVQAQTTTGSLELNKGAIGGGLNGNFLAVTGAFWECMELSGTAANYYFSADGHTWTWAGNDTSLPSGIAQGDTLFPGVVWGSNNGGPNQAQFSWYSYTVTVQSGALCG